MVKNKTYIHIKISQSKDEGTKYSVAKPCREGGGEVEGVEFKMKSNEFL